MISFQNKKSWIFVIGIIVTTLSLSSILFLRGTDAPFGKQRGETNDLRNARLPVRSSDNRSRPSKNQENKARYGEAAYGLNLEAILKRGKLSEDEYQKLDGYFCVCPLDRIEEIWQLVVASEVKSDTKRKLLSALFTNLVSNGEENVIFEVLEGQTDRILKLELCKIFSEYSNIGISDLLEHINDTSNKHEKEAYYQGLSARIGKLDDSEIFDLLETKEVFYGREGEQSLLGGLHSFVFAGRDEKKAERLEAVCSLLKSEFSDEYYEKFLLRYFEQDEKLVEKHLFGKNSFSESFLFQIADKFAKFDPEATVRSVLVMTPESPAAFGGFFGQWLVSDEKAALEWIEREGPRSFSELQAMGVKTALIDYSLLQGDFEKVEDYLSELSESVRATNHDGQRDFLIGFQESFVRRLSEEKPSVAVEMFSNGRGAIDKQFLEIALGNWITSDSNAAANWMDKVGVALPLETRQYAAIPYAYEAARQGDLQLARQWADLVIDEASRNRVMEMLKRTEASTQN